jgi:hypothetical protein
MSITGFHNILSNKLADEIQRYYCGNMVNEDELNLVPIYIEAFLLEFGQNYFEFPGVQETLTALAIGTGACLHASYQSGETNEKIMERICIARLSATAQVAKFETLFLNVAAAISDDDDSE